MQRTTVTVTVYCSTPGCPAVAQRSMTAGGARYALVTAAHRSIRRRDGWEVAGRWLSGDEDVCPACRASRAGEAMAPLLPLIGRRPRPAPVAEVAPVGAPPAMTPPVPDPAPDPDPLPPAALRVTPDPVPEEWRALRKTVPRPTGPAPAGSADATVVLELAAVRRVGSPRP